jgi:hypothetical protein
MNETKGHFSFASASPLYQLFIAFATIMAMGIVLFIISMIAGSLISGIDISTLKDNLLADSDDSNINFIRYLVVMQDICFFIIPGICLLNLMNPLNRKFLDFFAVPKRNEALLVILLAFSLIPLITFTGQLNSGMHLPQWLSGIEKWMTAKEDEANDIIKIIIVSDSFRVLTMNLVITALLPAIGEEIIFRGVFQKIFQRLFRNDHVGIWVIAFIFSAIHLQFFGFLPRFIMGLAFGYLYYWSGNLWLPIIAHFTNNAIMTVGVYLSGWENSVSNPDFVLWKQALILPLPLFTGVMIMLYFRNESKAKSDSTAARSQSDVF